MSLTPRYQTRGRNKNEGSSVMGGNSDEEDDGASNASSVASRLRGRRRRQPSSSLGVEGGGTIDVTPPPTAQRKGHNNRSVDSTGDLTPPELSPERERVAKTLASVREEEVEGESFKERCTTVTAASITTPSKKKRMLNLQRPPSSFPLPSSNLLSILFETVKHLYWVVNRYGYAVVAILLAAVFAFALLPHVQHRAKSAIKNSSKHKPTPFERVAESLSSAIKRNGERSEAAEIKLNGHIERLLSELQQQKDNMHSHTNANFDNLEALRVHVDDRMRELRASLSDLAEMQASRLTAAKGEEEKKNEKEPQTEQRFTALHQQLSKMEDFKDQMQSATFSMHNLQKRHDILETTVVNSVAEIREQIANSLRRGNQEDERLDSAEEVQLRLQNGGDTRVNWASAFLGARVDQLATVRGIAEELSPKQLPSFVDVFRQRLFVFNKAGSAPSYRGSGFFAPLADPNSPNVILDPRMEMLPGHCFAFRAEWQPANVTIVLPQPIVVSSVSYRHIQKALSPDISAAPHLLRIFGHRPQSSEGIELEVDLGSHRFDYDLNRGVSDFDFLANKDDRRHLYERITVQITSNYGSNFTCLYRLRVYGEAAPRKIMTK